jgi:ribosomal protein S15P/S13E
MEKMKSIHPRSWLGGSKKNTAMPRSVTKLTRALKGIEKHLESHPRDGMSRKRVDTINSQLSSM